MRSAMAIGFRFRTRDCERADQADADPIAAIAAPCFKKGWMECRSVRHRRAVAGRCAFLSGGVPERGWWGGCCVEGDVLESEIVVERDKSRFIVQKRDLSEVNEL